MPRLRGSFNKQDAADATAEMAVQVRPPRSIPKALTVLQVPPSVVQGIIEREHYLHSMPAVAVACFAVYLDARLMGAVVFTVGSRNSGGLVQAGHASDTLTLSRLWLDDSLGKNAESRVLGVVLRWARRQRRWKLLLSYADPTAGHVGTIYQATGWLYLGQTEADSYVQLEDGSLHHPRSIYRRFGSNAVRHLQATGLAVRRVPVGRKHRYVYILDPSWRWRLRISPVPYPKAEPQEGRS